METNKIKETGSMTEQKKQIVAVDDSSVVIRSLDNILSEEFRFKGFVKGMRALDYLDHETPDLILLDIDMPEIDGFKLLEQIRMQIELKTVPVIFLTGNNDKTHVIKAIQGGANDYAIKPIDADILKEKIYKFLK